MLINTFTETCILINNLKKILKTMNFPKNKGNNTHTHSEKNEKVLVRQN